MRSVYLWVVVVAIAVTAFVSQLSFFFIEPQAAVSEGKVLVLKRTPKMGFIDSPRGYCQREYPTEDSTHCESRILPHYWRVLVLFMNCHLVIIFTK